MTKKIKEASQNESQAASLKEQLARVMADYDNLSKRVERERSDGKYLAKLVVISRLLPVFDMFYDAQKHRSDAGLGIALKVLEDTLKDEGILRIVPNKGDVFDHNLHEAVEAVDLEDGFEPETIAELSLVGYRFHDGPVIRHAKVTVYKKES